MGTKYLFCIFSNDIIKKCGIFYEVGNSEEGALFEPQSQLQDLRGQLAKLVLWNTASIDGLQIKTTKVYRLGKA